MFSTRIFPSGRLLAAALALISLCAAFPARAQAQVMKVMPLGDSITESQTGFASYRYWLWQDLQDFGFCVDFVGGQVGVNGTPLFPNFDQDHEGHTGWRADQVLAQINGWATSADPDIVLIHLGTNDLWQGQSKESTRDEIGLIIDELRAVKPRIIVILAQIIPMTPANVAPFNALLPDLVASKSSPVSPVVLVNQWLDFDVNADTWDGVHPDQSGELKIAGKFYTALEPFLLANNCYGVQYCFGSAMSCPCGNGNGDGGCLNSAGRGALISAAAGTTDVGADDLVLAITDMPPNKFGLAFMGASQPMISFGDGLRCVGGVAKRFNVKQSNSAGTMLYGPGLAATAPAITAGSTWKFQGWYRDPMGPCGNGFNLTNGVQVPFQP